MVSTRNLTSSLSSLFTISLVAVPNAPSTICITLTLMFNSCFLFSSKVSLSAYWYYRLLRNFLIGVSWWFSAVVLSTASLLKTLILFLVFWPMYYLVCTRPLISKSSSLCISLLLTVLSAPLTIDIPVTFMFHIFLLVILQVLFSLSFSFTRKSARMVNSTIQQVLLLFFFFVDYH